MAVERSHVADLDVAANPLPPRAIIISVYGLFGRDGAGAFSVFALVNLLAQLGIDEPSVRSAVSRLKARGLLDAQPVAGRAGYRLSQRAEEILREGDERIFDRTHADPQDGWVLAVFSVPERERAQRHLMRRELSALGFGTVTSGVWVAPARRAALLNQRLTSQGLSDYVDVFVADRIAFGRPHDAVQRWWDLADLAQAYQRFLDIAGPVNRRWARRTVIQPQHEAQAFADLVTLITVWRTFPYRDPGLAAEYLPRAWPGRKAADLFFALYDRLYAPAAAYCASVASCSRNR